MRSLCKPATSVNNRKKSSDLFSSHLTPHFTNLVQQLWTIKLVWEGERKSFYFSTNLPLNIHREWRKFLMLFTNTIIIFCEENQIAKKVNFFSHLTANTGLYAHYVFNTLDKDHTGTLSFEVSSFIFHSKIITDNRHLIELRRNCSNLFSFPKNDWKLPKEIYFKVVEYKFHHDTLDLVTGKKI